MLTLKQAAQVFVCVIVAGSTGLAAYAEGNWVERFLRRYSLEQAATQPQPGVVSLTTGDIVRLLLENNVDVSVNRLTPLSRLYTVTTLSRRFEPRFYAIANMDRVNSPSRNQLAGALSLLELTHNFQLGVDQELKTGTIYGANLDFVRGSSNSAFSVFNPYYNGLITYSLTQHILRDFGRAVNTHEIRIARNNHRMSELDFELQVVDLVTQALVLYWDLKFAGEDVKVKQRSLDLANKTLSENRVQVEIGTLAPIDLVQAEADVAQRNDALVSAQYNVELLQDELKKMIARDIDPVLTLTRLSPIDPVRRPENENILSLQSSLQYALESRRELKLADYDLANRDIDIQYLKNQKKPILDITASYSQTGLGGRQNIRSALGEGTIIETIPGGAGDVFNQLFGFNHVGYATGFNLRIPLRNDAARADYDRAINERQISTNQKAATAQQIALEVRNAYTEIQMTRARVATSRTVRELAFRKLDAEQTKFELGTSTIRFVLEEQRNLAQAETDEIQALVNYTKALINYDRAIGKTIEHNNIEIDKQLPTLR
jgi:outer membrane protein